jgi:hypothetical protein
MKYIILGLFLLLVSSCAGSLGAITSAIGGADFFSRLFTDKGVVDHAISEGQGKDCKISNLLKEKKLCEEKLIDKMIEMNCKIFRWTEEGNVVCERYKKK